MVSWRVHTKNIQRWKKNVDSPFTLFHYIWSWWNLIFDFGWSSGSLSLPHKRCMMFNGFENQLNQRNDIRCYIPVAVEPNFPFTCVWKRNICMENWADRCHRRFSQSRRAYLTMDDLYPWKNSCLICAKACAIAQTLDCAEPRITKAHNFPYSLVWGTILSTSMRIHFSVSDVRFASEL